MFATLLKYRTFRLLLLTISLVTLTTTILVSNAAARPIDAISGTWTMTHDDWRGTLVINPPDQRHNAVSATCTYSYWVIDGTYTGSDGIARWVTGTLGGRDTNLQNGSACPQTDHSVHLTINFPGNPQTFDGYLFTHQERTMAGYTWWQGIPFGWYARK